MISKTKFEIGDEIKVKNQYDDIVYGHVVLIISTATGLEYYCSMYPGAMSNFYYIKCIDPLDIDNDFKYKKHDSIQALNKFKEEELQHSNNQKIRKLKLNKLI